MKTSTVAKLNGHRKNVLAMSRKPKPEKKRKSVRLYFTDEEFAEYEKLAAEDEAGDNVSFWLTLQIRLQTKMRRQKHKSD
jgi:lipoate synthase